MTPVSFDEAAGRYPDLVKQILAKLGRAKRGVGPRDIKWYLITCHDDPEQPLDEGACADVMLTGSLPIRRGLCGKVGRHFCCYCASDEVRCGGSV